MRIVPSEGEVGTPVRHFDPGRKVAMETYHKTHGARKRLVAALIGVLMSLFLLSGCAAENGGSSSQSSSSGDAGSSVHSSDSAASEAYDELMVSVEIDPSAAAGKVSDEIDTTVFGPEEVFLEEGSTAYDALVATGVEVEGDPSFVTSIDGLAAGAAGPTSGWMYEVNGESPSVAANEYGLSEEDQVRWYYVDSFE